MLSEFTWMATISNPFNNLLPKANKENIENEEFKDITNAQIEEIQVKCFNIGITPLKLIFLHPLQTKLIYQQLVGVWFTFWNLGLCYWTVKYPFINAITLDTLFQLISSFGLYILAELKIIPVIYYNKIIQTLLNSKSRFWNAPDLKLRHQVCQVYLEACYFGEITLVLTLVVLLLFVARPLYDPGTLYTLQWFEEAYYWHALAYQTIFALVLVALVIGFNAIFFLVVAHMRAQFMILNWQIRNRKNDGTSNDMVALVTFVKHHRFLTRYVNDIEKVFMIQLVALYGLTIASCSFEFYAITETPITFINKVRCFVYASCLVIQMATFCFPAADLKSEIQLVSDSFYMSDWLNGSRNFQTWIPFAIHATQHVEDFKALGLFIINKMTLVIVAKSTFSFLTFMRSIPDEE